MDKYKNDIEGSEFDLLALLKGIVEKKAFVLKVTAIFAFIGLVLALFTPKTYTSTCTFIPQVSKSNSGGGLSSLAALAGINIGNSGEGEILSPVVYPQILDNIDLKKELMYSKIKFNGYEEPIALIDYYCNPEYSSFNLLDFLKEYTLGLPGKILSWVMPVNKPDVSQVDDDNIKCYTAEEYNCAKVLNENISISFEDKKGYITLIARMNEPKAAAQLCKILFDLLQKYVTEFKIQKAQNQYDFIEKRYQEIKDEYEEKQMALASFLDGNKLVSTAHAKIDQERLMSDFNMINTIYTEMAKKLLQADIQVKEDTPILTVIKPVVVPFSNSAPNRAQLLVVWSLMGLLLGCGIVIFYNWLKDQGIESKWMTYIR